MIDEALDRIREAKTLYHRLVLLVGAAGSGKTGFLREISRRLPAPILNVNLELSHRLLDLPSQHRAVRAQAVFEDLVASPASEVVLLDNIEVLFAPELQLDPIRLLQRASRNRTIVTAWNGAVRTGHLTYAAPGHPEHRRYPAEKSGVIVLLPEKAVA